MPLVILFAAGVVQGATGLGFTLIATPMCALFLAAPTVVGTVARTAVVVDLALVLLDGRTIDTAGMRRYGPAALMGAAPGVLAVAAVADAVLLLVAAAVAVVGGGLLLVAWARPHLTSGGWTVGAGALAGFFGVTTGLSGPPLAVHSALSGRPTRSHRATMAAVFLVIDALAVLVHRQTTGWQLSAALMIAALAGLVVGRRLGDATPPGFGPRAVGAVAVASGIVAFVAIA